MMVLRRDDALCCAREALQACCLILLLLASPARGQSAPATDAAPDVEMQSPRVSFAAADWDAARAKVADLDQSAGAATPDALAQLNGAAKKILPKTATSPTPVLLPFDPASLLRDQAQSAPADP